MKNQALAPISIVFLLFLTGCSANDESRTVASVESACKSLEVGWLYQSTTEKGQMAYAEAASAFRQLSSKNPEFVNFTKGASSAANGDLMYLRELYDALAFCGISTSP